MILALDGCTSNFDQPPSGAGGQAATISTTGLGSGASGGGGHGGMGGNGGSAPCGGSCKDPTPLCDKASNQCVACLADGDCKDAANAKCDKGSCAPCTASEQCKGHTGTEVCETGKCVECKLGEETMCSGGKTCDLTADKCVAIAASSVKNCGACSNDVQCQDGKCIALDFNKQPHGYFCLKAANPTCDQPFAVFVNKPSISGMAAAKYCGIDQDQTTCEAVLALVNNWVCSGMDGKCGPMGMPEMPIPGALCKQVGPLANRCTYSCKSTPECPSGPIQGTCGTGSNTPPGWCGG